MREKEDHKQPSDMNRGSGQKGLPFWEKQYINLIIGGSQDLLYHIQNYGIPFYCIGSIYQ